MARRKAEGESSEFLWLISLSDLMILLFIFFVVLYSFSNKKMNQTNVAKVLAVFKNEKIKDPVQNIEADLQAWVKKAGMSEAVDLKRKDDALVMEIKDQILFKEGQYQIHPKGSLTLSSLRPILEKIPKPYRLGIEGHTDDIPIRTREIRDNWDLASRRAHEVFRLLNLREDIKARTVLMSHGPMEPIAPNRDENGKPIPRNQNMNRRVTLRVF